MDNDASDLVRRCMEGDDAARAEFITRYDSLIRRAISRRIRRTAAARANAAHIEDIVQNVYLKLFADRCRALGSVRSSKRLDAWLVTVAQNSTVSYLRKHGAPTESLAECVKESVAPYDQEPDRQAISNEVVQQLADVMAQLEDKDRLVLQLYYVHNLRYADIATTLDLNINTVASRILRAKRKLRDALQEHPA